MYVLHYAPDNASLIVRIALEEIGTDYRAVLVDRRAHAHKSPEYLALNPNGLIPALQTPDGVVFETGAALLWLADRHGMLAPPATHPARGDFLKWLFFASNTLHANLRALFYPTTMVGSDEAAQNKLCKQAQSNLQTHLQTLNANLQIRDIDALSLYVAVCLRWCALYGPEDRSWFRLSDYPNLKCMAFALENRQSVRAAADAEGLGHLPFTNPQPPNPPEGYAL